MHSLDGYDPNGGPLTYTVTSDNPGLVSTFILTQRSAAVRRIATSENETAKRSLLPGLLSGDIFATVGISHLTTSGRHLKAPLVTAEPTDDGFLLTGTVPWAIYVVCGRA